jgi:hypothetical protein
MKAERELTSLAKRGRLRNGVTKRRGRSVYKRVFDAEVPYEDAVVDRILGDLTREPMVDGAVPHDRLRPHPLRERQLAIRHKAIPNDLELTLGP